MANTLRSPKLNSSRFGERYDHIVKIDKTPQIKLNTRICVT